MKPPLQAPTTTPLSFAHLRHLVYFSVFTTSVEATIPHRMEVCAYYLSHYYATVHSDTTGHDDIGDYCQTPEYRRLRRKVRALILSQLKDSLI